MAKRQELNGALLTEEEKTTPIGIGYVMAARRLGLKYLDSAQVMLDLLVEFGNEAWHFSLHAGLPAKPFWKAMNKKADGLAAILKGRDPGYMATSWFTDPHQLRAHLRGELEKARPTDPPGAVWRKDPIREHARSFMAFFLELSENALVPPSSDPMEKQSADHIRKYAGAFLNMDPAMLSLQLGYNPSGIKPAENPESCKSGSESPHGEEEPTVHYTYSSLANTSSDVYACDVRQLLVAGQRVLESFRARGVERKSLSDADFQAFLKTLYTSGMVMTDFDGCLFYNGPGRLIENALVAEVMMSRANLLTIRMFLHTMARGYRACEPGYGFPCFAEAYKSGGLKALLDRLDWLCEVAETNESETLYTGCEIEDED